jgi:hypothetical protein
MITIQPTKNIKAKKYSVWHEGVEVVRSLTKKAAIALEELYNNVRRLQSSCENSNESLSSDSGGDIEQRPITDASTERCLSSDHISDELQKSSNTVSIRPNQSTSNITSRGTDSVSTTDQRLLYKENCIAEFRQIVKSIRNCDREQHQLVLEQHQLVLEQHQLVCQNGAIALWAIQQLRGKNLSDEGSKYVNGRNPSFTGLEPTTIDIEPTKSN